MTLPAHCACCQRWTQRRHTPLCLTCERLEGALQALVGRCAGACAFSYGPTASPQLLLAMREVLMITRPELRAGLSDVLNATDGAF